MWKFYQLWALVHESIAVLTNNSISVPFQRDRTIAEILVRVGEYEDALDKIEYLLSIPGEISISLVQLDPRWVPLREHPRFQELLKRNKSNYC